MSTTARVTLEGKSRLPLKVQEAVIDIGNAVASTANASGSAETLGTLIRNYVGLDTTIENSASNLAKLGGITDRLQAQIEGIDNRIVHVSDVQEKLQSIERSNFCATTAAPSPDDT